MRLIKRKKGNNEYYYLQYSFRKKGKVTTKEKYIGIKIPEDIEKIKKDFKKESGYDLEKKFEKIKENFQKEWKRIPKSAKENELEQISVAFTYNTNAIEGSKITLKETREIIQDNISPNKLLSDVKETEAHSRIFLAMIKKNEKITSKLILNWHKEVFGETKKDIAGELRDYFVSVGDYFAPDWQDVKKLMDELMIFIMENKKINPVELSGRVHYKFEKIHPFGDGNGRVGRLLMNFILWHAGYPMLIIEYKKRGSYYNALKNDEEKFINYYFKRYLAVHKRRYLY